MNDSISSWLSNLFGNNSQSIGNGLVANTPMQAGVDISGTQSNNIYQTPGLGNTPMAPSGLQYAGAGINALQGLASVYLGFQNANTAKAQAAQAQQNWNTQWDANVKTTNASLADRQRARVASNPTAYESVDSYMSKYGIS